MKRVCSKCDSIRYRGEFLDTYYCDKHSIEIDEYDKDDHGCDDYAPDVKTRINFRKIEEDNND